MIRPAGPGDAAAFAAIAQVSFLDERPWVESEFAALLALPTSYGWISVADSWPVAFLLCQMIVPDAEILSLAVMPACRRRGHARALLGVCAAYAAQYKITSIGLECAADNEPAQSLYARAGCEMDGRRRGYYRKGNQASDAIRWKIAPGTLAKRLLPE
ncbi:MAG TPA: N-acetyltransferase [Dongiaceae bacterium]|jgi:ribosomal-protein-alanine N-acetyltransferase|nr:N-acetyltransferase [Dongiaceae bacterium]